MRRLRRVGRAWLAGFASALLLAACASPAPPPDANAPALAALVDRMASRPIVLLGEVHDNARQHALRAQALRGLLERGARPVLVMEMFDRERQGALDHALATPGIDADAVIDAALGPVARAASGWDWTLYRPYVALALAYRLPIAAANVSRADTRRILADGLQAHGFDPAVPADIRRALARAIVDGHCGMIGESDAERLVGAQVARDQSMARLLEAAGARGAVLLAGNGHVRSDVGVPRWLSPAARERSVAIGFVERGGAAGDAARPEGDGDGAHYDFALATPAQPRADPCAAMRGGKPG